MQGQSPAGLIGRPAIGAVQKTGRSQSGRLAGMADEQDEPNKPRQRWFQFSLRTLMLFVVVASHAFAWLGVMVQRARDHRQANAEVRRVAAEIGSKGGMVRLDVHYGSTDSRRVRPTWLENLFGDPGAPYRYSVGFFGPSKFDDDDMVLLKGLTNLTLLTIHNTQATNAGLVHLKSLT